MAMSRAQPVVSVIICTLNRAKWLHACLSALAADVTSAQCVEVVIVDNGSTDTTAGVVETIGRHFDSLRYCLEPRVGLSHARNRGVSEAHAEWIAFLDDDARPLPGYVQRLLTLVAEARFDCVGGVYLPWYAEGRAAWFRDEYASNALSITHYGEMPPNAYASGGNCVIRRAALNAVGGFNQLLGMRGGVLAYGEETRLQIELLRHGYRIGGDPALRIEHLVAQRKQHLGWLLRQAWSVGRDSWATFDRQPNLRSLAYAGWHLFSRPVAGLYREIRSDQAPKSWRTLALAIAEPGVRTVAELLTGVQRMMMR